ncbi:hypothetical protein ACHAQJ_010115 [Trichoderma viride]
MPAMSYPAPAESNKAKLDTFHYFSQLAPELQQLIWGFAARDYKNGAHFVAAVRKIHLNKYSNTSPIHDAERDTGYALIAPTAQDAPGSVRDWVVGNPSSYIQDSGLWIACFQSRNFMKRRYMKLNNLFSNGYFVHKKETWSIKVCPSEDLFCIQPLEISATWLQPSFELPKCLHYNSWNQFKNIAMEYDPEWLKIPGSVDQLLPMEESARGCFIRTLWAFAEHDGPPGLTLWLIDRTIRKRNKPLKFYMPHYDDDDDLTTREPRVFHGNDRRYVEIDGLGGCEYDVLGQNTAFHFLHWLQIDAGLNTRWMMRQRTRPNPSPPRHIDELVKVLCEEKM